MFLFVFHILIYHKGTFEFSLIKLKIYILYVTLYIFSIVCTANEINRDKTESQAVYRQKLLLRMPQVIGIRLS